MMPKLDNEPLRMILHVDVPRVPTPLQRMLRHTSRKINFDSTFCPRRRTSC